MRKIGAYQDEGRQENDGHADHMNGYIDSIVMVAAVLEENTSATRIWGVSWMAHEAELLFQIHTRHDEMVIVR